MIPKNVKYINHKTHHEYIVRHLNTYRSILTSKRIKFEDGDYIVIVENRGLFGANILNFKLEKRIALSKVLYGHTVFRRNGNNLDYRIENCTPFSMSLVNILNRKYPTKSGYRGVHYNYGKYYWTIMRGKKVIYSKSEFLTADACAKNRAKYIEDNGLL
mgnify:CR=1 FL=1